MDTKGQASGLAPSLDDLGFARAVKVGQRWGRVIAVCLEPREPGEDCTRSGVDGVLVLADGRGDNIRAALKIAYGK
jgi:hypothetical protein